MCLAVRATAAAPHLSTSAHDVRASSPLHSAARRINALTGNHTRRTRTPTLAQFHRACVFDAVHRLFLAVCRRRRRRTTLRDMNSRCRASGTVRKVCARVCDARMVVCFHSAVAYGAC